MIGATQAASLGVLAGVGLGLALPLLLRRGPRHGSTQAVRGGGPAGDGPSIRIGREELEALVARCLEARPRGGGCTGGV